MEVPGPLQEASFYLTPKVIDDVLPKTIENRFRVAVAALKT
jgi:hypothetical protein